MGSPTEPTFNAAAQGDTPPVENNGGGESTGGNPAWNDLLSVVPTSLHGTITPHLQKWDQGVQERFQTVHSQYEPYKPFLEAQLDPNELAQAYQVYQMLNQNPRQIYDAMTQHYGWGSEQGQAGTEQTATEEDYGQPQLPEDYAQYKQMVELMGQHILTQEQQRVQAQEDAQLDTEIQAATQKYGQVPDEHINRVILPMIVANPELTVDAAFAAYAELVGQRPQQTSPSANAPQLLTPGGGLPSQAVSPPSNPKDRKALVADMLRAAAQS